MSLLNKKCFSKTILAVLSTRGQCNQLLDSCENLNAVQIFCDNPALYSYLEERGVTFDKLEEDLLRDKWKAIDTWACKKALLWDQIVNDKTMFCGLEMNKALYVYFSFYLTSVLKNYLYVTVLFDKYSPEEVVVFEDVDCPDFPQFNGNYFLNFFLKKLSIRYCVKTVCLKGQLENPPIPSTSVKERIRSVLRGIYETFPRVYKKEEVFVACGGLNHLSGAIKELQKQGEKLVIFDPNFNMEQLFFCNKNNILYRSSGCFGKKLKCERLDDHGYHMDFKEIVNILRQEKWFVYEGEDLSSLICDEIEKRSGKYLREISLAAAIYSKVLESYDVKGVILDEDISPRSSFMAAFFKSKGIRNFCISHGYHTLRVDFEEPERIFDLSDTFVHSEYEKKFYASWGWKEERIKVMGIPRYDGLIEFRNRRYSSKEKGNILEVLLCPSSMLHYSPDKHSYMGSTVYEYGTCVRMYLKDMIEAIEGYPIRLVIKPHYKVDEILFKEFLKKNKKKNIVILKPASYNIFELMANSHYTFFTNWSTSIMESIICNTDAAVIDYFRAEEDFFPFAKNGALTVTRNLDQLRAVISKICRTHKEGKDRLCMCKNEIEDFFTGINDGGNTQRVVDHILVSRGRSAKEPSNIKQMVRGRR